MLAGCVVGGLFAIRILTRNRDWNNDIALYSQTLEISPGAYRIMVDVGGVYWRAGEPAKAESLWRRALALDPENVDALNSLGLVERQKKQYAEAAGFFVRAIKKAPNLPDPHRNLGTTLRFMGMPGPAELQLRAALALSPLDSRVLNELGALLLDEKRDGEAEDLFSASVRNSPNVFAYDFLGEIHVRGGSLSKAEQDFQAALDLDESDSNAHFGLGDVYRAVGRNSEAVRQYQAGLSKDPTNAQALAALQMLRQASAGATSQPPP